jgi:hypothetical protein
MPNINEVIASLTDDMITPEARETLITEVNALTKQNSQLYQRAKKAEGFEYDKSTQKWVKSEAKPETPTAGKTEESNEPDYSKIAYLNSIGFTHPDDQKNILEEATRLKLPLTDIVNMGHMKTKLTDAKDQREAQAGMPKGRGRGGGQTRNDIDYWIDRKKPDGTFDTPEDHELAIKVINARIKKEGQVNQFSDTLYTG